MNNEPPTPSKASGVNEKSDSCELQLVFTDYLVTCCYEVYIVFRKDNHYH